MTDPILKRRDDESVLDWKIRLCDNKDKYSLTWETIKDIINAEIGEKNGESVYRKWWYSFYQGLEYSKTKNIESDEVLNELETKKIELLEERKKLQTIRTEYNKIAREKARRELLFDSLKDSFEKLDVPEYEYHTLPNSDREFVLSFGDIHFGKQFKSIANEYNEEIASQRLFDLVGQFIPVIEKEQIHKVHLINLGDSIEGATLRVSQLKSLQSGFVDQFIKFSKLYAKFIRELSKYVNVEVHHVGSSNHTELRAFNTGRGEMPQEDLERAIGEYLKDVLEGNERVNVHIYEDGIAKFKIFDYEVFALHGHQIAGKKNAIHNLTMLHKRFIDYLFIGHYHHGNNLTVSAGDSHNIEVIQTSSIMGSDEYSDKLMTGAKAGAELHIFEKGKGRIIQYNFILN
jgi:hypothetical protein